RNLSCAASPQIEDYTLQPENCHGDANGSIHIEVNGGNKTCGSFTYKWTGPNGFEALVRDGTSGSSMNNLESGFYDVLVTDCKGKTTVQDIYL
ncbi:MAG: SprB repeat-containing protein, partial [Chitinophagales bacterium]